MATVTPLDPLNTRTRAAAFQLFVTFRSGAGHEMVASRPSG